MCALPQNVVNQFMALGRDPRVGFLGNVGVGRDVQLQELRAYYKAVTSSSFLLLHRACTAQACSRDDLSARIETMMLDACNHLLNGFMRLACSLMQCGPTHHLVCVAGHPVAFPS